MWCSNGLAHLASTQRVRVRIPSLAPESYIMKQYIKEWLGNLAITILVCLGVMFVVALKFLSWIGVVDIVQVSRWLMKKSMKLKSGNL